jgi:hypothetical protein
LENLSLPEFFFSSKKEYFFLKIPYKNHILLNNYGFILLLKMLRKKKLKKNLKKLKKNLKNLKKNLICLLKKIKYLDIL